MNALISLEHSERCHPGIHASSITTYADPSTRTAFLVLKGSLLAPVPSEFARTIGKIMRRGARRVVINLARLTDIDAAGVGELVGAFNSVRAAGGVLRITHATGYVRRALELAGVLGPLTGSDES